MPDGVLWPETRTWVGGGVGSEKAIRKEEEMIGKRRGE